MSAGATARTQLNAWIAVLAALALAVVVNYLGAKYYWQWDFTESGLYTLSERTTGVLSSLERDVRVVSFLDPQRPSPVGSDTLEQIDSTLDAYRAVNPARITIERLDPYRDVVRAQALLREFDIGYDDAIDIVVIEAGERRKQVRLEEMVEIDPEAGYGGTVPVSDLNAEAALTAAFISVTRSEQPVVAFATGHGERIARGIDGADLGRFVETLEREDIRVQSWDPSGGAPPPEGSDLVVVAAPTEPWLEGARTALEQYLARGGRCLLLLDPVSQRAGAGSLVPTGLEPLLESWGIGLADDVVLDPEGAFFGSAARFVLDIRGGHPVTDGLAGLGVVFQVTRSLTLRDEPAEGIVLATLIESGDASWGETDLESLFDGTAAASGDASGPLPLLVEARRSPGGETADDAEPSGAGDAVVIVAGDADLAANAFLDNPGNRGLALNLVSYLLEQREALGIPPKDRELSRLFLRGSELLWLFPIVVLLLPALSIAAAIALWTRRRRT